MTNTSPLVTIYMPTKNRVALVERAVQSVLDQTIENWELIVVNDGSTDGTKAYLDALTQSDPRIKAIHHSESKGACASRNEAIQAANGEFVTGLDDDDEFTPNRLARLLKVYDDTYAFVCAGAYWTTLKKSQPFNSTSRTISANAQLASNEVGNQILVRKERMLAVCGFDTQFIALQDYECFYRLIEQFGPAYRLGEPLMKVYVEHGEERISANPKSVQAYYQFREKHGHKMSFIHRYEHNMRILMRQGKHNSLRCMLYKAIKKLGLLRIK